MSDAPPPSLPPSLPPSVLLVDVVVVVVSSFQLADFNYSDRASLPPSAAALAVRLTELHTEEEGREGGR